MTCSLHHNGPWGNPPANIAAQFPGSSFVFLPVWLKTDISCKRCMDFNFGGQMEDVAAISCSFPQYTCEVCFSMFFYISKIEVGARADRNNPQLSLKSWWFQSYMICAISEHHTIISASVKVENTWQNFQASSLCSVKPAGCGGEDFSFFPLRSQWAPSRCDHRCGTKHESK